MVLKVDHIGIAVEDLDASLEFYTKTLGIAVQASETVEEQKVKVAFLPLGDTEIELLESTDPEGPIAKHIAAKGQGVQHIAFRVENLEKTLAELKEKNEADGPAFKIKKDPRIIPWAGTFLRKTSLDELLGMELEVVATTPKLHRRALEWAERLAQSRAYDAQYLALAEQHSAELWTGDKRLVNGAAALGVDWVHWVGEA